MMIRDVVNYRMPFTTYSRKGLTSLQRKYGCPRWFDAGIKVYNLNIVFHFYKLNHYLFVSYHI